MRWEGGSKDLLSVAKKERFSVGNQLIIPMIVDNMSKNKKINEKIYQSLVQIYHNFVNFMLNSEPILVKYMAIRMYRLSSYAFVFLNFYFFNDVPKPLKVWIKLFLAQTINAVIYVLYYSTVNYKIHNLNNTYECKEILLPIRPLIFSLL